MVDKICILNRNKSEISIINQQSTPNSKCIESSNSNKENIKEKNKQRVQMIHVCTTRMANTSKCLAFNSCSLTSPLKFNWLNLVLENQQSMTQKSTLLICLKKERKKQETAK